MEPTAVTVPPLLDVFHGLSLGTVLAIVITIIFIWWAVFTLVAAYHWLRFGRDSWVAFPAFALHLLVSAWIFAFAIGGIH